MNAQDTANNILVEVDGESHCDLLGNSRTAPVGITREAQMIAALKQVEEGRKVEDVALSLFSVSG